MLTGMKAGCVVDWELLSRPCMEIGCDEMRLNFTNHS